jgi:sodium-dependent dicarboxylate transporter 2/3/5
MPSADPRGWVPVVLRLTWRTPPGILLAGAAALAAANGWLAGPLDLDRPAEIAAGIVGVAAALWVTEAVPLFVTSILVLALSLAWLGPALATTGSGLFLGAFFSDITLLFLGGFVLGAGLERTGLDQRLARTLLARAGAEPRRVLLATMTTTALLSMWMSNTAACALMLGIARTLLRGVPPGDGFPKALVVGIAFSANLGGMATPIGSPPNAVLLHQLHLRGLAPGFGAWILLALPLLAVLLGGLLVALPRWFPTTLEAVSLESDAPRHLGGPQALVLTVLTLTVAGWLLGDTLGVTSGTVALLPVVVFFATGLLRTADLRALPWEVLLLIGGGLALGTAIEQSGLASILAGALPTADRSPTALLAATAILALVVSSFMSNTAAANLLAPVVVGIQGVGLPSLVVVGALACSLAMPLPVSTPPNAMAFGFSRAPGGAGELAPRDLLGPGLLVGALGLAGLIALAEVWFPVVLGR